MLVRQFGPAHFSGRIADTKCMPLGKANSITMMARFMSEQSHSYAVPTAVARENLSPRFLYATFTPDLPKARCLVFSPELFYAGARAGFSPPSAIPCSPMHTTLYHRVSTPGRAVERKLPAAIAATKTALISPKNTIPIYSLHARRDSIFHPVKWLIVP